MSISKSKILETVCAHCEDMLEFATHIDAVDLMGECPSCCIAKMRGDKAEIRKEPKHRVTADDLWLVCSECDNATMLSDGRVKIKGYPDCNNCPVILLRNSIEEAAAVKPSDGIIRINYNGSIERDRTKIHELVITS